MLVTEIFESFIKTFVTLKEAWIFKTLFTFIITFAFSTHGTLLIVFTVLIFIDLFTKFLSLAKKYTDDNKIDNHGIGSDIYYIPAARRAGYIKSQPMKTRFVGKFVLYCVLILTAQCTDVLFTKFNQPAFFVEIFVGYMAITEITSILENLDAADIKLAKRLLEVINVFKLKFGGKYK